MTLRFDPPSHSGGLLSVVGEVGAAALLVARYELGLMQRGVRGWGGGHGRMPGVHKASADVPDHSAEPPSHSESRVTVCVLEIPGNTLLQAPLLLRSVSVRLERWGN